LQFAKLRRHSLEHGVGSLRNFRQYTGKAGRQASDAPCGNRMPTIT
jgi:hypothetical protein